MIPPDGTPFNVTVRGLLGCTFIMQCVMKVGTEAWLYRCSHLDRYVGIVRYRMFECDSAIMLASLKERQSIIKGDTVLEEKEEASSKSGKTIPLQRCIERYCAEARLGASDPWYALFAVPNPERRQFLE